MGIGTPSALGCRPVALDANAFLCCRSGNMFSGRALSRTPALTTDDSSAVHSVARLVPPLMRSGLP
jgi:hypothetical protein